MKPMCGSNCQRRAPRSRSRACAADSHQLDSLGPRSGHLFGSRSSTFLRFRGRWGGAKAFKCLPAFEQMPVKCPVFPPSFLSFSPSPPPHHSSHRAPRFSALLAALAPPLPSTPQSLAGLFAHIRQKTSAKMRTDVCFILFFLGFFSGFFILTMLSCDCSSISRPCSVRRRSLISVLDVWMDSVLMATSLVRVADWRETHRHLLGEKGVSAGNYSVQCVCVSRGCKPAR